MKPLKHHFSCVIDSDDYLSVHACPPGCRNIQLWSFSDDRSVHIELNRSQARALARLLLDLTKKEKN